MTRLLAILFIIFAFAWSVNSQTTDCPSGKVCIDQSTANQLFNTVEQLIAAKDTIAKMLQERGASDAAINSALKTIEGWKALDEVNNLIILKQKDMIQLYERTVQLYAGLVETLEKRLAKPKSPFAKFLDAIKTVLTLAAGVALGRGL